jgi:hypothetical protein
MQIKFLILTRTIRSGDSSPRIPALGSITFTFPYRLTDTRVDGVAYREGKSDTPIHPDTEHFKSQFCSEGFPQMDLCCLKMSSPTLPFGFVDFFL